MHTISLVELTSATWPVTELTSAAGTSLSALSASLKPLVNIRRTLADGHVEFRPGTMVGTIVIGALRVDVRPRLSDVDLVALIRYAYGDAFQTPERSRVGFDDSPGLDELLGRVLAEELEMIRGRGVARRYVERRERVSAVRGRVDFLRTFPWNDRGMTTLACRFHELSCDNPDNRLIAAALADSGTLELRAETRARLAAHRYAWRAFVPDVPRVAAADFAAVRERYTRLTEHYRLAHHLCEAILLRRRPRAPFDASTLATSGLSLDMARLFERVVERLLREALTPLGYRVGAQSVDADALRDGAGGRYRTIRPDLIIWRERRPVAVVDAKYKDLWERDRRTGQPYRRVGNDDLYQLFFYAARLQLAHRLMSPPPAILVAPMPTNADRAGRPTIEPRHRTIRLHAGGETHLLTIAMLQPSAIARDAAAVATFVRKVVETLVSPHAGSPASARP